MNLVRITNAGHMIVTRRLTRSVSLYTKKYAHFGGAGGRTFCLVYFHY